MSEMMMKCFVMPGHRIALVKKSGCDVIVDSDHQSLWIEATGTARRFDFKNDVVVRHAPSPTESRIDVRSVSRVGKSGLSTNARRIQAYLARVK